MSIRIENVVTPSPEQWKTTILGARNAMNSWEKGDSHQCELMCDRSTYSDNPCPHRFTYCIGPNDLGLMMKLRNAGTDHRKFMRMITVYTDITAPLYWWKEFDTYKVGTVANSCSTMHKIADKEFTLEDFSCEHLCKATDDVHKEFCDYMESLGNPKGEFEISPYRLMQDDIIELNAWRDFYLHYKNKPHKDLKAHEENLKKIWWQMIQLLPSSYNQRRTVMLNYEVLANIYKSRKNHKLDEWHEFCAWIETLPYAKELIIGE